MTWLTVSNTDWEALTAMFSALLGGRVDERGRMVTRTEAEMRRLFNLGLPSSPAGDVEQTRARTIIRERVREVNGDQKFNDPYFALELIRVLRENPTLADDLEVNKEVLWNAYYARGVANRDRWRRRWTRAMGRQLTPNEVDFGDT